MSNDGARFARVSDPGSVTGLRTMMEAITESQYHIRASYLTARNWAAVPVESACHFDDRDEQLIGAGAATIQAQECWAIPAEFIDAGRDCYLLDVTPGALNQFNRECSHFNYLLLSTEQTFAVLCTVADYYLISGPHEFVTASVGGQLEVARYSFDRFVRDGSWPEPTKKSLWEVAERYRPFNGFE